MKRYNNELNRVTLYIPLSSVKDVCGIDPRTGGSILLACPRNAKFVQSVLFRQ